MMEYQKLFTPLAMSKLDRCLYGKIYASMLHLTCFSPRNGKTTTLQDEVAWYPAACVCAVQSLDHSIAPPLVAAVTVAASHQSGASVG